MPRPAWIATLVGVVAALAAAGLRLARGRTRTPLIVELAPSRTSSRFARGESSRDHHAYACSCGMEYRVSGGGRHRVFWAADAPDDAPVLGDRCLRCDAPLQESVVRGA
jgi:hypothetical protein